MERQYYFTDYATITAAQTRKLMIVTPAQRRAVHAEILVQVNALCTVALYEAGDRVAGTAITPLSADRVHTPTPLMTASHTPTGGTTDGTLIGQAVASPGASARIAPVWKLKRNRQYVILLTAGAANSTVSTLVAWDEPFSFITTSTTSTTSTSSSSSSTTSSTTTA